MNTPVMADENVWYRQFYVWLVIVLPLCAVLASFATLYIAMQNPPEMVVEDYSRIEAIAAERMARDRLAAEFGLTATVVFGAPAEPGAATPVVITLRSDTPAALPANIRVRVTHSTTSRLDEEILLGGTAGRYTGAVRLPQSNFDLHIENEERSWRLSARPETVTGQIELAPPAVGQSAVGR